MGIDIEAKLIYGCNYADLPEDILDDVDEMLDDASLDYAIPYYDAPRDEWIVGVSINANGENHFSLGYEISQIDEEIPDILARDDLELKVYVSAHVS